MLSLQENRNNIRYSQLGHFNQGWSVFESCTSLTEVTNLDATPQRINAGTFQDVMLSACTLRVPEGSLTAYRTADVWKDFGSIEEMTTVGITGITVHGSSNCICITNNNGVALKEVQIIDMQGRIVHTRKGRKFSTFTEEIPVNGPMEYTLYA